MRLELEERRCLGVDCPITFKVLPTSKLTYCHTCAVRLGVGTPQPYGRSGKQGAWARRDDVSRAGKAQR